MRKPLPLVILIVLILGLCFPGQAHADGIIIPDPPICDPGPCPPVPLPMQQLEIRYHHVTVKIDQQIATTHVDQVFYNPNDWTIEGTYLFPLPKDAVVSNFILWVDGKPVQGQVLSASEARQKYEEIVRSQKDPALLEYADRGAVQATIYPIPPQGERQVELEYTQVLTVDNGLVAYNYPLNTEKFSAAPLESVSISVEISSGQPIRAVYSPTHDIVINRLSDTSVTAGYEANNVLPDTDFSLYYSVGETEAFHLLTYRDPTDPLDPDGFFLMMLAPRPGSATDVVPKDILLVLDRSGSMDGEKFRQAQEALRFVLQHLNPEDRFNIITFSNDLQTYASGLRSTQDVPEALSWVDQQTAEGSTDINRALLEAASMIDKERPTYLIFLTDGLPTMGETNTQRILNNFAQVRPNNFRLFAFGVGYDVDTILLDTLAQGHHGTSTYVRPGDSLDEALSTFYSKISAPVLTNLSLNFGNLSVYDLYPNPLSDLFLGSQIIITGRYRAGGVTNVTLIGNVNGEARTFSYPEQSFTQDGRSSTTLTALPRLWATRKIGYLLNQVRLQGPDQETVDQIVKLSIRYGIVTPYTSYLVTEPLALGVDAQEKIVQAEMDQFQSMATAPASGEGAVNKAADQGAMAGAQAPAAASAEVQSQVRAVGSRTFLKVDGVWTDTAFDPQTMTTHKVGFLSDDYFALASLDPDIAAALALGDRVIFLFDQSAYEIVTADTPTSAIQLPTPVSTEAATPAPSQQPSATPLPGSTAQPGSTTPKPAGSSSLCAGVILPLLGLLIFLRKRR